MNALIDSHVLTPSLHVGAPTDLLGYSVFPLWTDRFPARSPLHTLIPDKVVFRELDSGPSVSKLVVDHAGPKPFLLLEGTVVAGGWQDRVATIDQIILPATVHTIEVRCVEVARWGSDERRLRDVRRAPVGVLSALRGLGRTRPQEVIVQRDRRRADQGEVWSSVAAYQDVHGHSATGSLNHAMDRADEELIEVPKVVPLPGQQGIVVAANGHPLLAEVFNHPTQLRQQLPRIVASLAADRHRARPVANPGWRVRAFVEAVSSRRLAMVEDADTGSGSAMRAQDRDTLIDACAISDPDGRLQHLSVLNARHSLLAG